MPHKPLFVFLIELQPPAYFPLFVWDEMPRAGSDLRSHPPVPWLRHRWPCRGRAKSHGGLPLKVSLTASLPRAPRFSSSPAAQLPLRVGIKLHTQHSLAWNGAFSTQNTPSPPCAPWRESRGWEALERSCSWRQSADTSAL